MKLAISRKREFLADLGAVELTHDAEAMISALQKISGHAVVKKTHERIALFFIENPFSAPSKKPRKASLWDTHPSIEERIAALRQF